VRRASHLSLELQRIGDASVVSARGDIDLSTVAKAAEAIAAARANRGSVYLDLREVGFMDTSGLRLIIEEQQHTAAHGYGFRVFPGPPNVQRLFDIAGLAGDEGLFADPSRLPSAGGSG